MKSAVGSVGNIRVIVTAGCENDSVLMGNFGKLFYISAVIEGVAAQFNTVKEGLVVKLVVAVAEGMSLYNMPPTSFTAL